MKKYKLTKLIAVFSMLVFSFGELLAADSMISASSTELRRIQLEERLEGKLRGRLQELLQDENVVVVVKLRLEGEPIPTTPVDEEDSSDFALPGVPVEKNLTEKKEVKKEVKENAVNDKILNIYAWIFISKNVSENILNRVKTLSSESLGIDKTRGDLLSIETYARESNVIDELEGKTDLIRGGILLMISVALLFFLFFALIFLFGPVRIFFKSFMKYLSSVKPSGPGRGGSSAGGGGFAQTQAGAIAQAQVGVGVSAQGSGKQDEDNIILFSYINENNIEDLAYILSITQDNDAVAVLSNISEVLAAKALSLLPLEKQQSIINLLQKTEFTEPEQVKNLHKTIETKIKNIYGGSKRISRLMQGIDPETRHGILGWLKENNSALANEIENNVVEFEDILEYDDQSFRKIFREAGQEVVAQALKTSDDKTISKAVSKLTKEIGELFKEHINVAPMNKKMTDEAKLRLAEVVNKLIEDGFIEPVKKS